MVLTQGNKPVAKLVPALDETASPGAALQIRSLRGRLKSREGPRESDLGRMARRERRASPLWAVRSEQRRQTAQSAFALRVAWLFGLGCVAPQLQTTEGMRLRRALPKPKIQATRPIPTF